MPRVTDLLDPRHIAFLDGDKDAVIASLCRIATADAWQRKALEEAVLLREQMASTALDCGVAVPHAHIPELDRFVMAVGVVRDGLRWDDRGDTVVRTVVLIGAPEGQQTGYLKLLSTIVKMLESDAVRDHIASCCAPDEVAQAIIAHMLPPPGTERRRR